MMRRSAFACPAAALAAIGLSAMLCLTGSPALAAGPGVSSGHGAVALSPVQAQSYSCMKPGVPVCMEDNATFVSADRMTVCQSEVKEYVDRTMAYLKCLNDENISTGRELTRNVDRFNCRLAGQRACN
ncbi:hypothetical protein [Azospirillum thermophilum]|uniref:Uncharacterized protein n=1 Tax=Azospirillum thermophilum TaxID=2202148 RepID=A0A2S2CST7_9PROT|nr:hypothetical protein [Azospirillum thermophilum]AWK87485.1 hypothetical protein DEW08_15785 [Azospirillum thermophilum]